VRILLREVEETRVQERVQVAGRCAALREPHEADALASDTSKIYVVPQMRTH